MNSNLSTEDLLKKEILYKSLHRGSKECDLVIGGFVRESLPYFSILQLEVLKNLVSLDDIQFFRAMDAQDPAFELILADFQKYLKKIKRQ